MYLSTECSSNKIEQVSRLTDYSLYKANSPRFSEEVSEAQQDGREQDEGWQKDAWKLTKQELIKSY